MLALAKEMTAYLATVESVYHRCVQAREEVGRIVVADGTLQHRLRQALDDAIDDWKGVRRLAYLMARDIGYVVDVRRRVVTADVADAQAGYVDALTRPRTKKDRFANRRTVDALLASLGPQRTHGTRKHTAELLNQLFRKDDHTRHIHRHVPKGHNHARPHDRVRSLADVTVDVSVWGGSKSIFDQLVTPVMAKHGVPPGTTEAGQRKRNYDTVPGPGMSDHYVGNKLAYAIDYPTYDGEKAARAAAKALGIDTWQPGSYRSFVREVDGHRFAIQILWAVPDHYDHVHIGIHRV
jgi:hypothetical protein